MTLICQSFKATPDQWGLWFNKPVLTNITQFLKTFSKTQRLEPILVGVSGGADSLCLLHLLQEAGVQVIVAHFNHHLRPEADAEAEKVRSIALDLKLQFVEGEGDAGRFAKEEKLSLEEAARKLRYRFLFDAARKHGAGSVAVAHHADDQVETVLMHLLRGAGLSGLKGMTPVIHLMEFDPQLPLIRPLLQVWRSEIDVYCHEKGLEPIQDSSNLDTTYFRNRLRHELIPLMESQNPGFKANLLRTAETLAGDLQIVETVVDSGWSCALLQESKDYLSFKMTELERMDIPLLRNLVRRGAGRLKPGLRNVEFDDVDRLVQFIVDRDQTGQVDLTGGLYAFKEDGNLILTSQDAKMPMLDLPQAPAPFDLVVGTIQPLNGTWTISSKLHVNNVLLDSIRSSTDPYEAWLDARVLGEALQVRAGRAGDRVQPLGMTSGSLKLSDVYTNEKIPRRARHAWPLLCAGEKIAWVPGYRPAHQYRITETTSQVLHLEIRKAGQ